MEIIKLTDEVCFEIIEKEMAQEFSGYIIKCNRVLNDKRPQFKYKDDIFFIVSIAAYKKAERLHEGEFKDLIEKTTIKNWINVREKDDNETAFTLTPEEVNSRDSYMKTFCNNDFDKFSVFYNNLNIGEKNENQSKEN